MQINLAERQEMSENVRLSAIQEKAISLLLANQSVEKVAGQIGVTDRTLYRWLALPHFQNRLQEERDRLRKEAFDKLKSTLNKAVERLGELLDSDSESIKLRSAQAILDYNIRVAQMEELEERIKKLEGGVK